MDAGRLSYMDVNTPVDGDNSLKILNHPHYEKVRLYGGNKWLKKKLNRLKESGTRCLM